MNNEDIHSSETVLDSLIDTISKAKKSDKDYVGDDGLLYCGDCKTRKQFEIEILGKLRKVPVMCKCREEQFKQEEQQRKVDEMRKTAQRLKIDGITDEKYLQCTFAADDMKNEKLSRVGRRYVAKWEQMKDDNIGILYYGNVGTGKTFFAACIANALTDKGVPVLMTNVPLLISAMQKDFETNKASILKRISNIPLLILDDLGIERDTAYGYEKLQEVIDTRYRSGKPLIVTTNLSPQELQNPTDMRYKRVYDRVLEMCHPILVNGESRRKQKAIEKRQVARNILEV